MQRLRMYLPGIPAHVVHRGHNRAACFLHDEDYVAYLDALATAAHRYSVEIHAYVLMTNHVHLLATPVEEMSISCMMSLLGERYVTYFNRTYARRGNLWEGRHKASLVEEAAYFLRCMRYIDLNPVRAGIAPNPEDYPWSSFRHHARDCCDPVITDHDVYLQLGSDAGSRRQAYLEMVNDSLSRAELRKIRHAVHFNYPLGGNNFRKEVESRLSRCIGFAELAGTFSQKKGFWPKPEPPVGGQRNGAAGVVGRVGGPPFA